MLSNLISIGDKIDLKKISNSDKRSEKEKRYVSQLLEYNNEQEATIAVPIVGGRVIPLEVGDKYQLCFYTSKGLYQCEAVIINRYIENNIYLLNVRFLSDFEKFQRRQYYRLNCNLDIEYRIESIEEKNLIDRINEDQIESKEEKNQTIEELYKIQSIWEHGKVIDISGGGLRFIANTKYQESDRLRIRLQVRSQTNQHELILFAYIISAIRLSNKAGFYEHRVEFIDITNEKRESIIKFIFQEERRIRRKEKGLE